jgi:hypothetical protein
MAVIVRPDEKIGRVAICNSVATTRVKVYEDHSAPRGFTQPRTDDAQPVSAEWTKRAYVPEDEDALVYLWCNSYLRSAEGIARGCYTPFRRADEQRGDEKQRANIRGMWAEQAPLVEQLLRSTTVEVVCDPERAYASDDGPSVVWGFASTSGDVVHYVSVKRNVVKAGLGPDIVRALLGDRLDRKCFYTHELVEMVSGDCGVRLPSTWTWHRMFLGRHLAGVRRVAGERESVRTA